MCLCLIISSSNVYSVIVATPHTHDGNTQWQDGRASARNNNILFLILPVASLVGDCEATLKSKMLNNCT